MKVNDKSVYRIKCDGCGDWERVSIARETWAQFYQSKDHVEWYCRACQAVADGVLAELKAQADREASS